MYILRENKLFFIIQQKTKKKTNKVKKNTNKKNKETENIWQKDKRNKTDLISIQCMGILIARKCKSALIFNAFKKFLLDNMPYD